MSRMSLSLTVASALLASSTAYSAVVTGDLVFNYDGDGQTATTWTSSSPGSNTTAAWNASGTVAQVASGSANTSIATAYDTSGGGFTGAAFSTLGADASFEVWFKPDSLTGGKQVIFETGGSGKGLSLTLWNSEVRFAMKSGNGNVLPTVVIPHTLAAGDIADFVQVVVTVASGGTTLYVNPVSASSPSTAVGTGGATAFDGTDAVTDPPTGAGLGMYGGALGGSTGSTSGEWGNTSFTTLDGKIGLLRVYNDVLSGAEVADNFDAVVIPEPASLALLGLGMACLRRRRRV